MTNNFPKNTVLRFGEWSIKQHKDKDLGTVILVESTKGHFFYLKANGEAHLFLEGIIKTGE